MHDQTTLPKAVTDTVVSATSNARHAEGWPRNPGIVSTASTSSDDSDQAHPPSSTSARRDVDSYPLVSSPEKNSGGSGAFRSSSVRPRSLTSSSAPAPLALSREFLKDGEAKADNLRFGEVLSSIDELKAQVLRDRSSSAARTIKVMPP
eukprot:CAMPEP_0113554812 /NCGR_PEP_ID=MMETSP0015_2-20120614/16364_1 /TAXON_ID=2838 /ORGANISM="Odontella" /LENGTH=148 /DNA_ID=CAMNT_0000456009 /DNA_START=440 /DNA_END=886 /DNA_ORIENTATION=- /assembly_acc=CAM_ASM_000160